MVVLLLSCLLGAAMGLLLGTIIDPQKISMVMSVILLPITFLGCIYCPWSALAGGLVVVGYLGLRTFRHRVLT